MAIHIGTTMSQEGKDQHSQSVAKVTEHWLNTLERGEQLEQRMLNEMIAKAKQTK